MKFRTLKNYVQKQVNRNLGSIFYDIFTHCVCLMDIFIIDDYSDSELDEKLTKMQGILHKNLDT